MSKEQVIELEVSRIIPDPVNLRQVFDADDIAALADNLVEHGQMDPIIVFPNPDGTFDLLDGERRWRAAQVAHLPSLRARVVPRPSDTELLCKKISRAMQTRNLTLEEEVRALEQGLEALGVRDDTEKWPAGARKLGVKIGTLRERMRVANLTPELRQEFERGDLDYTIAQALGRIPHKGRQQEAARFVRDSNLSNRFVMSRFVPAVLENEAKSMIEVYDLARQAERFQYVKPRKEEVPDTIADKIDEMLATFRSSERWLEAAGREDLISYLDPTHFNTKRLLTTLRRLNAMISAFLSAYGRTATRQPTSATRLIEGIAEETPATTPTEPDSK